MLLAQRDLTDFWSAQNLQGSPVAVRDALLLFMPELVSTYGDAAALLGADWYDMLRGETASASTFRAVMARPVDSVQAQASARWGLGPLFNGSADDAFSLLTGATQRLVMQPFRDTVFESASLDPVRTGVVRVPSGPTTCRFCIMLASRGARYSSEDAAQRRGRNQVENKFHDGCDCAIVTIRSAADFPEDYDVRVYERLYREGSGQGRDIPPEKD